MKFLFPAVTCILTSHMKPYLRHALLSVTTQTRKDIQVLVVDSGQWVGNHDPRSLVMDEIYHQWADHPLVEWVFTGEGPDLRRHKCPISYVTNEVIRAGLIRGRYVSTFYDDDRYEPTYMERMAGFLDEHPESLAVWCSQNRAKLRGDGSEEIVGAIHATEPHGPDGWDCRVDGTQVMFRREVLDAIGDPWLPEDPADASCRHSDGLFLEKLGKVCGTVPNIPEVLVTHRFTPLSTYSPSG